jgi:hypothetical protein
MSQRPEQRGRITRQAGEFSREAARPSSTIDDLAATGARQSAGVSQVALEMEAMQQSNGSIADASESSRAAVDAVKDPAATLEASSKLIMRTVAQPDRRLGALMRGIIDGDDADSRFHAALGQAGSRVCEIAAAARCNQRRFSCCRPTVATWTQVGSC